MSKAYDFLNECGFYYLLTVDGNYPSGRPINRILEKDGIMYFGAITEKPCYCQIKKNPNVCIVGFSKDRWIRIYGKADETHDKIIREEYLIRIPMEVERFGTSENPLLAVFGIKVSRAELHSPGDVVEDIT
ncbi:MAG: pyridoxamine 5'-phosphate oxidase family protein [Synergistaceae bacterium]|nr:pyridoxamine 5'-phosphate oxidase family protein [Synergistaceae bacterium]